MLRGQNEGAGVELLKKIPNDGVSLIFQRLMGVCVCVCGRRVFDLHVPIVPVVASSL